MVDGVTLIQFTVPLIMALVFSVLTITPKGKDKPNNVFSGIMVTFMSSLIASISWFIFGLTWPAIATDVLFVSVAYLWYAIGIIFAVFTLAIGVRMLGPVFNEREEPRLRLQESDGEV